MFEYERLLTRGYRPSFGTMVHGISAELQIGFSHGAYVSFQRRVANHGSERESGYGSVSSQLCPSAIYTSPCSVT
jgi:hypothetical protein